MLTRTTSVERPGLRDGRRRGSAAARTFVLVGALLAALSPSHAQGRGAGYPRLLSMNISTKNYHEPAYQDAMARFDIVILGFYPGWRGDRGGQRLREVVTDLKRRNPRLLVGQYTVLNESGDNADKNPASRDRVDKLNRENWWLRKADGSKTSWTERYSAYDINFTQWSKPDVNGDRYPQWLAKHSYQQFFAVVPDFDLWYFDNVMIRSRVSKANWRLDGVDVSNRDPEIETAFRRGMADHWEAALKLKPGVLMIGNTDNDLSSPEYRGRLHGAFLEGLMGHSWSIETRLGWRPMMQRYLDTHSNLRPPAIVGFNASGRPTDYAFFRYAFCSALMGEGYFSYSDSSLGYSSPPWFDEYDVRIGKALDATPTAPWMNGVYRRRYEHAMALVNPETTPRTVTIERGWKRVKGSQDPVTNNGEGVIEVQLAPRSGLLLVKA